MNRARLNIIAIILVTLLVAAACSITPTFGTGVRGSGKVATETRQVSGFNEISVCCGMQLLLTQGQEESLEL
jgi:hypothetical protein